MPKLIFPGLVAPARVKPELVVPFPAYYGSLRAYHAAQGGGGGETPSSFFVPLPVAPAPSNAADVLIQMDFNGTPSGTDAVNQSPNAGSYGATFTGNATLTDGDPERRIAGHTGLELGNGGGVKFPTVDFGTDDWTMEAWVYPVRNAFQWRPIIWAWDGAPGGFALQVRPDRSWDFRWKDEDNNEQFVEVGGAAFTDGVYSLIVIQRRGNNIELYVNGTKEDTTAIASTDTFKSAANAGDEFRLGEKFDSAGGSSRSQAVIDQVRVTDNEALYTEDTHEMWIAFPNDDLRDHPDPADAGNIELIITGEGTNLDNTPIDLSGNRTFNVNGTPYYTTTEALFGTTSYQLNCEPTVGASDSVDIIGLPEIGTGDFSWECWVKFATVNSTFWSSIMGNFSTTTNTWSMFVQNTGSGTTAFTVALRDGAAPGSVLGGNNPTFKHDQNRSNNDGWMHFVACRSSGVLRFYIDGIFAFKETFNGNMINSGVMKLGRNNASINDTAYVWIQNLRVIIGEGCFDFDEDFQVRNTYFT